jgi:protocatechuate 3,4-dioxygenase alpha subunit
MADRKMTQTAGQTIGPYFAYCLTPEPYGRKGIVDNVMAGPVTKGEHIRITGRLLDGDGGPMDDALIEVWQANAAGRYDSPADARADVPLDPSFKGFGRCMTDRDGRFTFDTVKPGRVPGQGNRLQAPHVSVIIHSRGMLSHACTRIYFSDEAKANDEDPVLASVEAKRRPTVIARREDTPGGPVYHLDIHMQGEKETVFFDA